MTRVPYCYARQIPLSVTISRDTGNLSAPSMSYNQWLMPKGTLGHDEFG